LAGSPAISQITDVSGEWSGTIEVFYKPTQATYFLTQDGLLIEGYIEVKSLNGRDSAKAKLSGVMKGMEVTLRSNEWIYKVGPACFAKSELQYTKEGENEFLRGKWKGDLALKTCPPGTFGKIEVAKLNRKLEENQVVTRSSVEVAEDDQLGQLLVKELQSRKYYALIIGIDDYKDSKLVHLDQPISDALEFKQTLTNYYSFEEDDIVFLKNPDRTQIIDAFDALATKVTERDQLLVFYAGHGIWDEKLNQGYWLPSDARHHSKAQWLSNGTIRDYIGGIKSKHTLLITDACFSGGIFKERGANFSNSRAIIELYKMPSRKAMTSGTLTTVPDKSVFVKYLIKNLQENDLPMVSAGELFQKFKIAVINNSQNGQVPQYGAIGQAGDEGGEFIFLRNR
jgi:hypothetical protein